jgi:dipeptidyl aminopeptidase/acylaminoacyl peptidase
MTDFDFDKFLSLPRLSALKLSPDGTRLVAAVQRLAPDGKKMRSAIWQLDPAGARPPIRLTRSAPGESVGAFARDGSLLFTSSRPDPDRSPDDKDDEETTALWLLPAAGGEARLLCAPSGGIDAIRTARSADALVFAASRPCCSSRIPSGTGITGWGRVRSICSPRSWPKTASRSRSPSISRHTPAMRWSRPALTSPLTARWSSPSGATGVT